LKPIFLADGVGQTFEHARVLVEDADHLRRLCFEAGKSLGRLALERHMAAFKFNVGSVGLGRPTKKCRLILDEQGHRLFQARVAVPLGVLLRHGRLGRREGL